MASWLTDFYRPTAPIADERIAVTGGASQNLACLLQSFTDPVYTRNVWIVAPAYMLAFRIFDDSALKLRAVPEDEQGIDIEYLRSEIRKSEDRAQAQSSGEEVSHNAAHQCLTPIVSLVPTGTLYPQE
jgi:DNA-binding transcriptional MocR family regulator